MLDVGHGMWGISGAAGLPRGGVTWWQGVGFHVDFRCRTRPPRAHHLSQIHQTHSLLTIPPVAVWLARWHVADMATSQMLLQSDVNYAEDYQGFAALLFPFLLLAKIMSALGLSAIFTWNAYMYRVHTHTPGHVNKSIAYHKLLIRPIEAGRCHHYYYPPGTTWSRSIAVYKFVGKR